MEHKDFVGGSKREDGKVGHVAQRQESRWTTWFPHQRSPGPHKDLLEKIPMTLGLI